MTKLTQTCGSTVSRPYRSPPKWQGRNATRTLRLPRALQEAAPAGGWPPSRFRFCFSSARVVFTPRSARSESGKSGFSSVPSVYHLRSLKLRNTGCHRRVTDRSLHSHHPPCKPITSPVPVPPRLALLPSPPSRSMRNASLHLRPRPTPTRTIRHPNRRGRSEAVCVQTTSSRR